MAQQTLQTVITLSGRIDNSFGRLGTEILLLGNQIDALSRKVIGFGKESTKEFVQYDDIMREVQALGEYDDKTISALNEYNKTIAQTSKYTMDQAAQAEVMMAQLGLNIDQTKTLMPSVMNLASAANIDLASSLDYLYYTLNALGMPMESVNTLSDQMAKTAAISAADIDTLGQSMQRLGSGAQYFAGGSSEILAILGGIAQFGHDMQGSNAGTQLRNFMLTLLAPTKGKTELMESLSITEEAWAEFESYMADAEIDINDTSKAMEELGLSVFDSSTGKIKPAIQILSEMTTALGALNDPKKEKEILGGLFGKRTTITAENLIAALDTIIAYKHEIENESAGYTQTMAETMEGGLGGTLRNLSAAWDAFETTVGKNLAPEIQGYAEGITNIVNGVANMDEDKMRYLIKGLEAIAVLGPSLIGIGASLRLIGSLMSPTGQLVLGLTALAATIAIINEAEEIRFENNFGEMALDSEQLTNHINSLSTAFQSAYAEVNVYKGALDGAIASYNEASSTLSSNLLTSAITGATLTPEQIENMNALGTKMGNSLISGINASFDMHTSYLNMLFGDPEEGNLDESYMNAINMAESMYGQIIAQAEQLGREFGETMGNAMDDNIITGDEYAAIMKKMQEYNQAMSMVEQAERDAELEVQLKKAQSVSWDSADEFLANQAETLNADLAAAEETYIGERKYWESLYNQAIEQGLINPYAEVPGTPYTEADRDALLEKIDRDYANQIWGYQSKNYKIIDATMQGLIEQSDLSDVWSGLQEFSASTMENGVVTRAEFEKYQREFDANERNDIASVIDYYVEKLGGYDEIMDGISQLQSTDGKTAEQIAEDQERARKYLQLLAMDDLSTLESYGGEMPQDIGGKSLLGEYSVEEARKQAQAINADDGSMDFIFDVLRSAIESGSTYDFEQLMGAQYADESYRSGFNSIVERLKEAYDFSKIEIPKGLEGISDYYAAYSLMYGPASVQPEVYRMPTSVQAVDSQSVIDQMGPQEMNVAVDGDTAMLSAKIDAQDNRNLTAYVDGNTDALSSAISSYNGKTITTNIVGRRLFSEGGRATEASIFGEAGPEWAIPEEHSARTAQLFDMARAASGFTWPELMARNGGLNAGGGTPSQIIYSPTIIANDASGVEEKLIEDKERLDNWWKEKELRDKVGAYV